MTDLIEAKIDQIIATCDGDLRGAIRALLLVNEHLEFELQQLQITAAHDQTAKSGKSSLH
jgi:hypothetical protein